MRVNILVLVLVFVFGYSGIKAQQLVMPVGTSGYAMGHASVALDNAAAVFNNPSLTAFSPYSTLISSYDSYYGLGQMGVKSLGFSLALPQYRSALGITAITSGDSRYGEYLLGISYSKLLAEKLAAAIKLTSLSIVQPQEYGNISVLMPEVSISAKLTDALLLGVTAFNPFRIKLLPENTALVPTLLRAGLSYILSQKLLLCAEIEKSVYSKPSVKLGLEYKPIPEIAIRAGTASNPDIYSFGAGWTKSVITTEVAAQYNSWTGYSFSGGVQLKFGEPKKTVIEPIETVD